MCVSVVGGTGGGHEGTTYISCDLRHKSESLFVHPCGSGKWVSNQRSACDMAVVPKVGGGVQS